MIFPPLFFIGFLLISKHFIFVTDRESLNIYIPSLDMSFRAMLNFIKVILGPFFNPSQINFNPLSPIKLPLTFRIVKNWLKAKMFCRPLTPFAPMVFLFSPS